MISARTRTAATDPSTSPRLRWLDASSRWWVLVIFALTLVAYARVLGADFVWDDDGHVTRASLLSLGGLWRIWFEPGATQQYYPVLHSAFWFEHHLWGVAPLGYHLVNVLLHATGACLFAAVLRRLSIPGAWLGALLFAVHPVCVESVAWISEQKNTLSTVFYLLAALAYLDFDATRRGGTYGRATVYFALALFTKTVTATLPAALLVIAWWRRGRIEWRRDVVPVLPWLALGLGGGLFTAHFERAMIGAQGAAFDLSIVDRVLIAGRVVWFYAAKLLWPANLVFIYPRWTIDANELWQYAFPLGAVAVLIALASIARRDRAPLAAALLFGGSLFPALGFVNVYPFIFSFVADHFQYLACLALLAPASALLYRLIARIPAGAAFAILAILFGTLGSLTARQAAIYRNNESLFRATLASNPTCWMARNNLGNVLAAAGQPAQAVAEFEAALRLRPEYPEAESNLGDQLNQLNRPAEAVPHLLRALKQQPNYAGAHNNLGVAYMALYRPQEGIAEFQEALRLQPGDSQTEYNLGLALATNGRATEALPHFEAAVRLNPANAGAQANLGMALALANRFDEAFPHFERAIDLRPDLADPHVQYARVLAQCGRMEAAVGQFRAAIQLTPNSAELHAMLARALRQIGRTEEAARELALAQQLGAGR
jgi:tetratricopeptide (TPR) repeat protein